MASPQRHLNKAVEGVFGYYTEGRTNSAISTRIGIYSGSNSEKN